MRYRKLQGTALFDGDQWRPDTVLVLDQDGRVEDLLPVAEAGEGVERFEGTLLPGLVNGHCHLELSHFHKLIPEGTGLTDFLLHVIRKRRTPFPGREVAIAAAARAMEEAGIAAVADICNTPDAIGAKLDSGIRWQSLVEVLNLQDETMEDRLTFNEAVRQQHLSAGLAAGLTAHAPYSVGGLTFRALNVRTRGGIVSVHNQETAPENELFRAGTGELLRLYRFLGLPELPLPVTGVSSLRTWLPLFTEGQTLLLVHNTFISRDDIQFARSHAARFGLQLYYCLCPNANLYIEGQLPPVDLLLEEGCTLLLGTDSLSSNHQLDLAAELNTLRTRLPHLPLEILLRAITAHGADALDWSEGGRFQPGKRPGVTLLEDGTTLKSRKII